jgi:SpoIID/LytB domain
MLNSNLHTVISRFLFLVLLFVFCFTFAGRTIAATPYSPERLFRVGLYFQDKTSDNSLFSLVNTSNYGFEIGLYNKDTQSFICQKATGSQNILLSAENGAIHISAFAKDSAGSEMPSDFIYSSSTTFYIRPLGASLITVAGVGYGGMLEYSLTPSGKITLINLITLDEYVKGVLPCEFIPSWDEEALKAGAVVIRTYALASIMGKHAESNFDVCASTHCQVYKGMNNVTDKTNAAVDATAGEIVTYNGKPALTVYHSSSIDATESVSSAWGSSQEQYPYLSSVKTPFIDSKLIPGSIWSKAIRPQDLLTYILTKYPGKLSGDIREITYEKGESGYVNQMTVTDVVGGSVTVKTSGQVRTLLSKFIKSANFDLASTYLYSDTKTEAISSVLTASGQQNADTGEKYTVLSADGKKTVQGIEKVFFVNGKGYGHGIGLSQYGAQQLSLLGYSYDKIIKTYYTGVLIEKFS